MNAARASPTPVWLVAFLSLVAAGGLQGQVRPAPGDTLRPDTVLVPVPPIDTDTVPTAIAEAAAAETPPRVMPFFPDSLPVGWAPARWEFDNEQLAALAGLTLLEFLEGVPGITGFRAGGFGRPEGLTAFGFGGGRVRVLVDGLEVDPVGAGAFELETIPLLDIDRITVDRGLSEILVAIRTFRLDQPDAHSAVELGTGVYDTRLLRALFSRGFGDRSVGTGGFDLATTQGIGIREAYSHSSAVFRYGYALTPVAGLQAEWRRTALDRRGTLYPRQTTRSELSLRGRAEPRAGMVVEGIVARVTQEEEDSLATAYRVDSTQLGLRAGFAGRGFDADGAIRLRPGGHAFPPLPAVEGEATLALDAVPRLALETGGRFASGDGEAAASWGGTGILELLPGISAFGTVRVGSRLVPVVEFPVEAGEAPGGRLLVADAVGWRAGLDAGLGPLALGGAAFVTDASPVAPLGLPFDRSLQAADVGSLPGIEGYLRFMVPGTGGAVSIDGWYTRLATDALSRPYAPEDIGRIGVLFHDTYFGGQLEPALRIEGIHHGPALVPSADRTAPAAVAPAYQTANLSLRLRILDVEAFLIWDNLPAVRSAVDLPGSPPAFQRIVYGAEWRFRG